MLLTGPRQIRLLEVAYADHPKRFTCRLVPVPWDMMHVEYLAISYMWGDPSNYTTVTFADGTFMSITKCASIILDTLYRKNSSIYVWIDSLCISQSDNDEKSGQIRLMNEIYSTAQQVVVSLGKPTLDSNKAMDSVFQLRTAILSASKALVGPNLLSFDAIFQAA